MLLGTVTDAATYPATGRPVDASAALDALRSDAPLACTLQAIAASAATLALLSAPRPPVATAMHLTAAEAALVAAALPVPPGGSDGAVLAWVHQVAKILRGASAATMLAADLRPCSATAYLLLAAEAVGCGRVLPAATRHAVRRLSSAEQALLGHLVATSCGLLPATATAAWWAQQIGFARRELDRAAARFGGMTATLAALACAGALDLAPAPLTAAARGA